MERESNGMNFYHMDSHSEQWKKISDGVEMLVLRYQPGEVRVILKFAAGKGYQRHRHPSGEEVYVIDGVYEDSGREYQKGSYLYYPPESEHAPTTTHGCTILVLSSEPPVN